MFLHGTIVLALGFVIAADDGADDAVKKEQTRMAGAWKVVSFEIDGQKPRADNELYRYLIIIDGDGKITAQLNNKPIAESTIQIDPTKTPKTLDQTFSKGGGGAGETTLGIYELKDDTLKCCYAAPGQARPATFSSKGNTLVVYRRQKGK